MLANRLRGSDCKRTQTGCRAKLVEIGADTLGSILRKAGANHRHFRRQPRCPRERGPSRATSV